MPPIRNQGTPDDRFEAVGHFFTLGRGIIALIAVWVLIIAYYSIYRVDSTKITVFQAAVTGTMSCESQPGTYLRWWATAHDYKKQENYAFEWKPPAGYTKDGQPIANPEDRSIQVQFNDGGKAWIGGNVQWDMPTDCKNVIALHQLYGSAAAVDNNLIRNEVNRAMTLTAPLMSATESYAARRAEFISLFADQLLNGTYQTQSVEVQQPDPITGEVKKMRVVQIVRDEKGLPVRAEESRFKKYGINVQPPTLTHFQYEPKVEAQIQQIRDNLIAIQNAQAEAKKAEQAAITARANGEAAAAKAEWDQKVIMATETTKADQNKAVAETVAEQQKSVAETNAQRDLDVQTLKTKAAEQYKQEQILIGQGDAARKAAVLAADGALQQKLDAWVHAQELWANAFAQYKGNVTPLIETGTTTGGSNAGLDFMQLMAMKAAKDLTLDMSIRGQAPQR